MSPRQIWIGLPFSIPRHRLPSFLEIVIRVRPEEHLTISRGPLRQLVEKLAGHESILVMAALRPRVRIKDKNSRERDSGRGNTQEIADLTPNKAKIAQTRALLFPNRAPNSILRKIYPEAGFVRMIGREPGKKVTMPAPQFDGKTRGTPEFPQQTGHSFLEGQTPCRTERFEPSATLIPLRGLSVVDDGIAGKSCRFAIQSWRFLMVRRETRQAK